MDLTYEQIVRQMEALDSDELISNGQPGHAAVLYQVFFERAKQQMQIFCKNLAEAVFDSPTLAKALNEAVNRGVSVWVITQETPSATNAFYKELQKLAKEKPDRVVWKDLASITKPEIRRYRDQQQNFCVVDAKAYRFDADTSKCQAVASMNQPKIGEMLSMYFTMIQQVAV